MRRIILLWISLHCFFASQAQLQKTIYKTYELPDSVDIIELTINGPFAVETWPGNVVMSEIRVSMYNGSEGLMKHLLQSDRYGLKSNVAGDSLWVQSIMMERPEIKNSGGSITELVDVRLFLPDSFEALQEGVWRRKKDKEEEEMSNG